MRYFSRNRVEDSELGVLRNVIPYIWPKGKRNLQLMVVLALGALIASKIVMVTIPFIFKLGFDLLVEGMDVSWSSSAWFSLPALLIIAYGIGYILAVTLAQMRDYLFARVAQSAVRGLALRTFEHLHCLSLEFHINRRMGALNRILDRGIKGVELIVRQAVLGIVPTLLELLFIFGILCFYFSSLFMLIMIFTMAIYLWITFWLSERRMLIRKQMNDADTEANAKIVDSLLNFEVVKCFGTEKKEAELFDQSMAAYEGSSVKTYTSLAILNIIQTVIFISGLTICRVFTVVGIIDGRFTLGDFVMLNSLLLQIQMPLNFAGTLYRETKQGLVDVRAMFDLLAVKPQVTDSPDAKALQVQQGELRFENVSFGYKPDRLVLKNISFVVQSGKTVGIVGPSGSGKSTLSRLIYRFYDVNGGRILIDGQDIRQVTQLSLRSAVGIVPQDTILFNETVEYNVRYGTSETSKEVFERAVRLAQVDRAIEHAPAGYQTIVGERGLKLSGGEKQRIAIARAILKDPPILILDEATSALDTHTERDIQSALFGFSRKNTKIVIAHRLSTVVHADEILVLSCGEIVERGTHDDLMSRKGRYFSMWMKQLDDAKTFDRKLDVGEEDEIN